MAHLGTPAGTQREDSSRRQTDIPGTYWVEKNTFLEIEEPQNAETGAVRREHSAPPSMSSSSASASSKDSCDMNSNSEGLTTEGSDADGAMGDGMKLTVDMDEEGDEEEGAGEGGAARKGKRPGKAYRKRFKAFTKEVETRVRRNPAMNVNDIVLPVWLSNDPWLAEKLFTSLRAFQANLLAGPSAAGSPKAKGGAPSAKRAASRGAAKSNPKRQCRPPGAASSSSSWWPSGDHPPAGAPDGSPRSPPPRGRIIMQL